MTRQWICVSHRIAVIPTFSQPFRGYVSDIALSRLVSYYAESRGSVDRSMLGTVTYSLLVSIVRFWRLTSVCVVFRWLIDAEFHCGGRQCDVVDWLL